MEAKKLFEKRFTATKDFGIKLGAVEFNPLSREDNLKLTYDFTEEEVREAVWQCNGLKSPRLDDFNFNFIKN